MEKGGRDMTDDLEPSEKATTPDYYEDELERLARNKRKGTKKKNKEDEEEILFQLLALLHSMYPVEPDRNGDYTTSFQELERHLNLRLAYFCQMKEREIEKLHLKFHSIENEHWQERWT